MTKLYRTALLATMVGTMLVGSLASGPLRAAPATLPPTAYLADAQGLAGVIRDNYAYLDDLPGGRVPASPQLDAERDAVHDADTLLRYAEDMITALADHHATHGQVPSTMTGRSSRPTPICGSRVRAPAIPSTR